MMRERLRHAIGYFALCGLAACSDRELPPTAENSDRADDPSMSAAADVGPENPLSGATRRYVFGFTARDPDAEDPRIVEWAEDPCGMTAFAAVDVMPLDDPALQPDYVVEFDAGGHQLHRWGKPYSAEILTLSGDRLHFRASHGVDTEVFWTTPDGAVGTVAHGPLDPARIASAFGDDARLVDCPELPVFGESGYLRCWDIGDASGRRRTIAFEGACT